MPSNHPSDSDRLLAFNQALLVQAEALAVAFQGPMCRAYSEVVGPHLRHLIEHYEALLLRARGMPVEYDRRARDPQLEASPGLAQARLVALQQCLSARPAVDLDEPVMVRVQGGLAGEFEFTVASSVGRELAFLGSHSVHHFAILKTHCLQLGMPLAADFGKAPATVAHERANAACAPSGAVRPVQSPQAQRAEQTKKVPCSASTHTL